MATDSGGSDARDPDAGAGEETADPSTDVDSLLARVAATDWPEDEAPRRAGRYEVGRRLGRGGLGLVHAGWDPQLRREIALKFVRPDRTRGPAGRRFAARLRREARVLARLHHRAIVQVLDIGEDEGQIFIAMELLHGPTLRAWAREQTSWRAIVQACLTAARGLAAAHREGVVHRDFQARQRDD